MGEWADYWGGVRETLTKETAPCCALTRDSHGRYCIGFCGPWCLRRPEKEAARG